MTKFYALREDGFEFQKLDLNTLDILRQNQSLPDMDVILKFYRQTTPLLPYWPKVETKFIGGEGKNPPIPDITSWLEASLVLSPKAYRYLGDSLKTCGELLPVTVGSDTYYVFNCLTVGVDDKENCSFKQVDGIDFELEQLTFKDESEQHFVFKSETDSYINLFCSDRMKNAVVEFELTGLIFDESLIDPSLDGLVY